MDSQVGQREGKLEQLSSETLQAYKWILEHQDQFEKEVFGPPVITVSVKDKRYADALETLHNKIDMMSFTAQSQKDFRKLQTVLCTNMKLGDIAIRTSSQPLEAYKSPFSKEELAPYGFDGWAIDFLDGPAPVLAGLCQDKMLHMTPVALKDISNDQYARMENTRIRSFIAGRRSYRITVRPEYGPTARSTNVGKVLPARLWATGPVDMSAKNELQSNIKEWKQEMEEIQQNQDTEKNLHARLQHDRNDAEKERVS